MPQPYQAPWLPGSHLHVYNRACEHNLWFYCERDYYVFLKKMGEKLGPYMNILSFNLLPNHWHANVELLEELALREVLLKRNRLNLMQQRYLAYERTYTQLIAQAWRDFANSYSTYLRLTRGRRGRLAGQPVRRVQNRGNAWHRAPVAYVLLNHLKHGLATSRTGQQHPWTSLHKNWTYPWLRHDLVIERFGGPASLKTYLTKYLRTKGQAFHALDEEEFFGLTAHAPFEAAGRAA